MPCEACGLTLAGCACSPLHAGPLAMCATGVHPADLTGGQPVTAGAVVSGGPEHPGVAQHDAGSVPSLQVFDFVGNCLIVHTF